MANKKVVQIKRLQVQKIIHLVLKQKNSSGN